MPLFLRSFITLLFVALSIPASAGSHGHARNVSARAMFNIGTPGEFGYEFLNFLQGGDGFLGPYGPAYASGTCYWNTSILDSNGWPDNACANGRNFGGGFRFPSSSQFAGQYTLDGSGLGIINLTIGSQFIISSGVSCGGVASGTSPNTSGSGWGYSSASSGVITTNDTTGTGFCIPFTNVGQTAPTLYAFYVSNTCSTTSGACTGAFIKNVRLYQQTDYVRLAVGNLYRIEYLQPIATMDPSYVRFMDWGPGDAYSGQCSYANRPKVTTTSGTTGAYWLASLPYTVSSGTNLLSVAAVTGTPAAMTHCEVATFRFGNTMNYGSVFGPITISAVSNANPGEVTTSSAHGFATGDVIIHYFSSPTNIPNLNLYPVCVTVIDSTHYTMQVFTIATNTCTATNVNTTTWGTYSSSGNNYAVEYASLNVGARVNAPVTMADGVTPAMTYFFATAGNYIVDIVFDKNSCGITDGSGNLICGAWLINQGLGFAGFPPPTPLEMEAEYINEVNALLTGGQKPVGLWINIPGISMVPTDPDFTDASDYPRNMARTIKTGLYPLCSGCPLLYEVWNEWWNSFYPTYGYYNRQNFLRYGVAGSTDFGTVRTVQMFEDIHNNSGAYNAATDRFAMLGGPPDAVGDPRSLASGNYDRIFGDATIMGDARWPNAASKPYAYFDAVGYAPYANASAAFFTANFTTMAAAWCTGQSTACALTPPFAPNCTSGAIDATYCLPWVSGIVGPQDPVNFATITDQMMFDAEFTQAASSVGKSVVSYEGMGSWATCAQSIDVNCDSTNIDGSHITTAAQRNYMIAIYQSASWAQAWIAYCGNRTNDTYNGGCGNLSEVTKPAGNFQFAFSSPDMFGSTTTEGSGLSPVWGALGTFNAGQP